MRGPISPALEAFLGAKVRAVHARSGRLSRLTAQTVGIRPEDRPYAPSAAHFRAANRRLGAIDRGVQRAVARLKLSRSRPDPDSTLRMAALVERQIDRARRAFGLFFEVFAQRGTSFAPALAACDAIAEDCFAAVRQGFPELLDGPLIKPLAYVEHSFSPATFRRGVQLRRLVGEQNPFPLVRVPYERIESPWGMGVILHEVGHNIQSDLGLWQVNEAAIRRRVAQTTGDAWLTRIWTRWQKEIFADLMAILLGGPASAEAMKDFLSYPAPRVMAFRPLAVHPVPYLRAFIMAEMVDRLGLRPQAARIRQIWRELYDRHLPGSRLPPRLVQTAGLIIPEVVDEVAFQPRPALAGHALVDVIRFSAQDERRILEGARALEAGQVPSLSPRHLVSASRYALERGRTSPEQISRLVRNHLSRRGHPAPALREAA